MVVKAKEAYFENSFEIPVICNDGVIFSISSIFDCAYGNNLEMKQIRNPQNALNELERKVYSSIIVASRIQQGRFYMPQNLPKRKSQEYHMQGVDIACDLVRRIRKETINSKTPIYVVGTHTKFEDVDLEDEITVENYFLNSGANKYFDVSELCNSNTLYSLAKDLSKK